MIVDNKIYEELNQIISNVEWWWPLSEVRPCNVLEFFVNFFFQSQSKGENGNSHIFLFWTFVATSKQYSKLFQIMQAKLGKVV